MASEHVHTCVLYTYLELDHVSESLCDKLNISPRGKEGGREGEKGREGEGGRGEGREGGREGEKVMGTKKQPVQIWSS